MEQLLHTPIVLAVQCYFNHRLHHLSYCSVPIPINTDQRLSRNNYICYTKPILCAILRLSFSHLIPELHFHLLQRLKQTEQNCLQTQVAEGRLPTKRIVTGNFCPNIKI